VPITSGGDNVASIIVEKQQTYDTMAKSTEQIETLKNDFIKNDFIIKDANLRTKIEVGTNELDLKKAIETGFYYKEVLGIPIVAYRKPIESRIKN